MIADTAYNVGMLVFSRHHGLYRAEQVRALDRRAIDVLGVAGIELMHRAAGAGLASLRRHWPQARRLAVGCGPGNNGGDGFLLAMLARAAGLHVELMALADTVSTEAVQARQLWEQAGGVTCRWYAGDDLPVADVYVDALYGTGLHRAPGDDAAALIERFNASARPVLALDVPSGLDADTGQCPGRAVRATVTVSFIAAKRGLYTGQSADHVGALELASLDLSETLWEGAEPDAQLLAAACLPSRQRTGHKGNYGHVLAIGGDAGMHGAIELCGKAALRSGAGLVSVATCRSSSYKPGCPELMGHGVDGPQTLQALLHRADVLALGPGLGQRSWGRELWFAALHAGKPSVLDADALNLLAREPRRFDHPVVLTPHPGEAARLLQGSCVDVQADRFAAARTLAVRYHAVVVLKGAGSLVADPAGKLAVCPWGNPGMASGGMGDVLTGVIAACWAQGCDAWQAACLGVGLHARAGDRAAAESGERGLLASDLFPYLRLLGNGCE